MAKGSKMITCRHCGREIAANAKVCPHCGGKNKKPIFKRVWFWILAVIVLFVVVGGGGSRDAGSKDKKIGEVSGQASGNETSSSENTDADKNSAAQKAESPSDAAADPNAQEASAAEGEIQTVYHVGDILRDGDMDIVYAASGEYTEENEFMQPSEGMKYIFLKFAFLNTSEKRDSSISFYSFECYADGYSAEAYYGGENGLSATLSAGRSTEGYIYFEVPVDAQEIEVEYETNVFTDEKITFAFEGNVDSGYVLEKNTAVTEGALQVGDTLEGDTLNITYLSCQEDSSDNMFINPKDGYTYVTCELEFENVSKSDVSLSYFSFDCFADGISCESAYFRDDAISATISAGRKAKGTVTFEVPKDAEVIEVEYLTNYWTSNRVVFNASDY